MHLPTPAALEATNALAKRAKAWAKRVLTFNTTIIGFDIPDKPTILSFERGEFRLAHIREEVKEIEQAISDEMLDETVDGLIDLVYVAMGTLVEMGVPAEAAFQAVHKANMKRVRGPNPSRGNVGFDAVKPPGWEGPYFKDLLSITRQDVETIMALRSGKARLVL